MDARRKSERSSRQPSSGATPAPTRGYKVLRADMTSLVDVSCAYAVGRTTTFDSAATPLRPGRAGLHFGRTPLDCAVDTHVRGALASTFPPPALAFAEVEAVGTVVADAPGGGVTDALVIVRLVPTDEWRSMCSGTVKARDADGTVRTERYRNGRRHSPPDPTTQGRTLPAIEWPDGRRDWYQNGLLHRCRCTEARTARNVSTDRDDGTHCARGCTPLPAIIDADGMRHWYMHGMQVEAPLVHPTSQRAGRQRARGDSSSSSLGDSLSLWSRWCTAPFASLST
ncbi:hypothetical protein pmac_cds_31 [Pandoravirus macleodensis]|uniref:Uncharacterized protein n=1 Tax=Pandoravirus macleodensis TaxID=2107707 RepID=A0A2U7UE18_9VIRU|nr:hypothetical protein pmac_cds_31 [Pandoravirus macleodensis]AVK76719.1 hypothetical protein pmac_cds_31 [Pandoravirus macleodensis]UMO79259.1 hypothetical protein [Pandoravirus aubagnensis]